MPIASIFPDNGQMGDPTNITLQVRGSGFIDPTTKINVDGSPVATVFVNSTLLTTVLIPSGASRPVIRKITVTGDPTVRYFWWTPSAVHPSSGNMVNNWYPPTP